MSESSGIVIQMITEPVNITSSAYNYSFRILNPNALYYYLYATVYQNGDFCGNCDVRDETNTYVSYTSNTNILINATMKQNLLDSLSDGSYQIIISALPNRDDLDPTTKTYNLTKGTVTYSPSITLHTSSPGNVRSGFDVIYSVTDQDGSTGNITIKLDGTTVSTNSSLTLDTQYTYTVSTQTIQNLSQGSHVLTFDSTDSDGNSATQKSLTFTNNKGTVSVSLISSSPGNIYNSSFDVSFRVDFDSENTCSYTISLDNTVITTKSATNGQTHVETISAETLQSIANNQGSHTITIRAIDSDGANDSEFITFTNYNNNSAPVIHMNQTSIGEISNAFSIYYTVTDADNDNVDITISLDGTEIGTVSNVQLGQEQERIITKDNLNALSVGQHTITITAIDSNDEISTKTITFIKSNTSPNIVTVTHTLGKKTSSFSVIYSVTDAEGDICSSTVTIDGRTIYQESNMILGQDYTFTITNAMLSNWMISEGNIEKTIIIEAEDDQGSSSSINITFNNEWRPKDMIEIHTDYADLGEVSDPFTVYYHITDEDGNRVQAKVYINDTLTNTISSVTLGNTYNVPISASKLTQLGYDTHYIKIVATNNWGYEAVRYIHFQIVSPNLAGMQHFTIDVVDNEIKFLLVKQHDHKTRFAKIELTDQGRRIKVSKDYDASIKMKTPDGRLILNDAQVLNDGTMVVEFTDAMLYKPGIASAEMVCVYDRYETLLSTPQFNIQILPTVYSDEDLENTTHGNNEYSTLVRILTELEGISSLADRITALETALANGGGGGNISIANYTDPEIRTIVATAKNNADNS